MGGLIIIWLILSVIFIVLHYWLNRKDKDKSGIFTIAFGSLILSAFVIFFLYTCSKTEGGGEEIWKHNPRRRY